MPSFKNIRIKKPGGGTRMQRVQVLANGKYKFVKNKKGGGSTSRKKSTKRTRRKRVRVKKSGGKRRSYSRRKAVKKVSSSSKMTPGNILMANAAVGKGVYLGLRAMKEGDTELITDGLPAAYTGFRPSDGSFEPMDRLPPTYLGNVNEIILRKGARMLGTNATPRKDSLLENVICFGSSAYYFFENPDNPATAYRKSYQDLHGVDLSETGFDAWEPGHMKPRMGLIFYKLVKKGLRSMGWSPPKGLGKIM